MRGRLQTDPFETWVLVLICAAVAGYGLGELTFGAGPRDVVSWVLVIVSVAGAALFIGEE